MSSMMKNIKHFEKKQKTLQYGETYHVYGSVESASEKKCPYYQKYNVDAM